LLNSFDQDSLETIGSIRSSGSSTEMLESTKSTGISTFTGEAEPSLELKTELADWSKMSAEDCGNVCKPALDGDTESCTSEAASVSDVFGLKKPFRLC